MKYDLHLLKCRLPEYLEAVGIELQRNGTRLVGRCPVHDDRKPSFAVFGTNHEACGCFPCDFKGDVFATSQWLGRSSSFPEAVRDVAAVLGCPLPHKSTERATKSAKPKRVPKPTPPPFTLTDAEKETVHLARLAFSDAFWSEDSIVDEIIESLGLDRETLRLAAWGSSGLGIARPKSWNGEKWLCYAYPHGLKWRNSDPKAEPRFSWIVGKATAPWRMEWVKPETRNVYLTESESDCLALIAAGLEADGVSVCVAAPGSGNFKREWGALFKGKRTIICFDNDAPGRKGSLKAADALKGHAAEILTWKGGRDE